MQAKRIHENHIDIPWTMSIMHVFSQLIFNKTIVL